MRISALLLALFAFPCVAQDSAAPNPYLLCSGCHGAQGEGNLDVKAPPLAGQSATYVARQLANYKHGQRAYRETDEAGQVMKAIAMTLQDDAATLNVADFISKMPRTATPPPAPVGPTMPGRPGEGRRIYAACAGCHGSSGEGKADANAPNIALLPAWYLTKALQDFRDGARGSHPDDYEGRTMSRLVRMIRDDQALQDVVAYVDGL